MKKVLYFPSNSKNKGYYELYKVLRRRFDGKEGITVEQVDKYLFKWFGKTLWYLKDKSYQIELYNLESEYIFCINK